MDKSSAIKARRSLWSRFTLEIRGDMSPLRQLLITLAGLFVGLAISMGYLLFLGVGAGAIVNEFIVAIFTNARNIQAVLGFAAPLVLVGLSAAFGFRVRFWNIGIEGQVIFGAIAATFVATHNVGPESLRILTMMIAAALGGMAWIALPLFLRIRLDVNEIISTLLMNYIGFNFLLHLLYGPWKDPATGFPNSQIFDAPERLMMIPGLDVSAAVLVSLAFIAIAVWLMGFSRFGFVARFVYANPSMARAVGVSVVSVVVISALISGALSGIAGFVITAGIDSRLTQSFFVGYGFSGILIGFLARNNPLAIVLFSLLIAVMMVAGQTLQVFYQIPFAMVQLIQATIVICVAASEFFIRHRIRMVD